MSIEFYRDGTALVRSYRYKNEDFYRSPEYPDQLRLEVIEGGPATFRFQSGLNIAPKGNNLYDISWNNPTLDSSQNNFKRLDYPGSEWQQAPGDGSQAFTAYCVGRNLGRVGNSPAVQVRLLNVRLMNQLLPLNRETFTMTVSNLQKQVSKASVTMRWNFQPSQATQQNMPSTQR
jgi:hypothetical protein